MNARWGTIIAWALLLLLSSVIDSSSLSVDAAGRGSGKDFEHYFVLETTSRIAIAMLLPLLYWGINRFPPFGEDWKRNIPIHMALTVPFSLAHIGLMVGMRKTWIWLVEDRIYDFGFGPSVSLYEYRKDFGAYITLTLIALGFNYIFYHQLRNPRVTGRLALRHGGNTSMVRPEDILRLDAEGNYVNVVCRDRAYEVRGSLRGLLSQMSEGAMVQVHKSHAVNPLMVEQFRPTGTGDAVAILKDGAEVRVSRRYRETLEDALRGTSD